MYQVRNDQVLALTASASTQSTSIDCTQLDRISLQAVYTDGTTAAKTFGGVREVDQITFAALASTTNGDYFVINDYLGGSWAVGLDTLGTGAATPTGAAWVAVASGNKVYTDVSSATTGTDVELLVATAINALTGFTAVIGTANSTTHMNCTAVWAGAVTAPTVYSRAGASGTGSITKAVTTPGTSSAVNTSTSVVTLASHGQSTGSKVALTTAGALPTGVTATNYWLIALTANTFQFASSLANAVAGTAISLTTPGYGTQTITPASLSQVLKVQVSDDASTPTNWTDIPGTTVTISSAGTTYWSSGTAYATGGVSNWQLDVSAKWMRILATPTSGQLTLTVTANASSLTRC